MHHAIQRTLSFALLLTIYCAGCSSQSPGVQKLFPPTIAPSPDIPSTEPTQANPSVEATAGLDPILDIALVQALHLTPSDAVSVAFTNWTLAKAYAHATELTGKSDLSTRSDFHFNYQRYALDFALAGGLFSDTSRWSFDSVDMLWEARIDFTTPYLNSTHLFMFSPTFDLHRVISDFTTHGYQQERYDDTTIYTRQSDPNAPWYVPLPSLFHAAILPEEHLLIFGATTDDVERILDVQQGRRQAFGDTAVIQSLLRHLGTIETALVLTGSTACNKYAINKFLGPRKQRDSSVLAGLHQYAAFGYGFRREENEPLAVAVLEYTNAHDAQTDQVLRHQWAVEGESLVSRKRYKDSLFTVKATTVEDQGIIFHLQPFQQRIAYLNYPVMKNDLLLAACPG